MERRGTLGKNEFRFSVSMFMSLQLETNERKLYVSAPVMRFLNDNVDEFIAYRIPTEKPKSGAAASRSSAKPKTARRLFSGCCLCPATDHQAWDTKFHPHNADGSRKKVSQKDKDAILARVQHTEVASANQKEEETEDIKHYWAQYAPSVCLRLTVLQV